MPIQDMTYVKERIISHIKSKGPSLPVQIARAIDTSPLFASAFLSELYGEKRLKMSYMKVGSSPLYYLEGQESMLENFIQYLNHKEREAFHLLKQEQLLDDETQHPAIRVALRGMQDFASPVKIMIKEESKTFWKHFLLSENDVKSLAHEKFVMSQQAVPLTPIPSPAAQTAVTVPFQEIIKEEAPPEHPKPRIRQIENIFQKEEVKEEKAEEIQEERKVERKKAPKITEESEFSKLIKHHLSKKEVELLAVHLDKKKEFSAKVKYPTMFGDQEFYLMAKDKKKISDTDLTLALQKAQLEKMPALVLSPGELDKKALEYIKEWRNLVKFEKI